MENEKNSEPIFDYTLSPKEREEVRARYPKTYFPDPALEPLFFGRRDKVRVPEKMAVIDQTAKHGPLPFAVCSEKYKIIYHEDILHLVENSVGKITNFGAIEVVPHTYLDGGRFRCTIKFPEMQSAIKKLDQVIPKIDVFSSYDLSTKLMGKFGAFQLKCLNGCGIWKSFKQFAKRHLQNLFLNDLGNVVGEGLELFGDQVHQWKLWGETKVPSALYQEIWDGLPFSETERKRIENLPEIGTGLILSGNSNIDFWQLNSALTQFSTHEIKSEIRRIELEPVIARVMEQSFVKAA